MWHIIVIVVLGLLSDDLGLVNLKKHWFSPYLYEIELLVLRRYVPTTIELLRPDLLLVLHALEETVHPAVVCLQIAVHSLDLIRYQHCVVDERLR